MVYRDIDFSECTEILEVGCGVGAQTSVLLRRFPKVRVTGIDMSDAQLTTCRKHLSTLPGVQGRYEIHKMDATAMDFQSRKFDGVFVCWVLEHIPDPRRVLTEVRRVLRPGGRVYCTEVMNHTFFLNPYSPNVWKYWMAFNDFQFDSGGDPFIGAKLGNMLTSLGFRRVDTRIVTAFFDNRRPEKRREFIREQKELLFSAEEQLIKAGLVTKEVADAAREELDSVQRHPDAVFMASFMQSYAEAGD